MELEGKVVKKQKGIRIYTKNKRWIDFYLEGGAITLGHAFKYVTSIIKETLSRGYLFHLPTSYWHYFKQVFLFNFPQYKSYDIIYYPSYEYLIYLLENQHISLLRLLDHVLDVGLDIQSINEFIKEKAKPNIALVDDNLFLRWSNLLDLSKFDTIILREAIVGGWTGGLILTRKPIKLLKEEYYNPIPFVAGRQTIKLLRRYNYNKHLKSISRLIDKKASKLELNIKVLNGVFTIPKEYISKLKDKGIYFNPKLPVGFISYSHREADIKRLFKELKAIKSDGY